MVCRRTLLLTSQRWKPVVLAFVSCWSSAKSEAALEFTLWALEGTAAQVEDERASEPKASSRLTGNWMGLTAAVVWSGLFGAKLPLRFAFQLHRLFGQTDSSPVLYSSTRRAQGPVDSDFTIASYSLRRYASNAALSSGLTNPRSTTRPFDERIGGRLGAGFSRATRRNKAS